MNGVLCLAQFVLKCAEAVLAACGGPALYSETFCSFFSFVTRLYRLGIGTVNKWHKMYNILVSL